jgi:hypothetical protein
MLGKRARVLRYTYIAYCVLSRNITVSLIRIV